MPDDTEHLCACPDCGGIATAAVAEIQRLRIRLAKIAYAPVPADNKIAVTLTQWAMPRDGEPENPMAGMMGALRSARDLITRLRANDFECFTCAGVPSTMDEDEASIIAEYDEVLAQIDGALNG